MLVQNMTVLGILLRGVGGGENSVRCDNGEQSARRQSHCEGCDEAFTPLAQPSSHDQKLSRARDQPSHVLVGNRAIGFTEAAEILP